MIVVKWGVLKIGAGLLEINQSIRIMNQLKFIQINKKIVGK